MENKYLKLQLNQRFMDDHRRQHISYTIREKEHQGQMNCIFYCLIKINIATCYIYTHIVNYFT
jgi:hypothetical protein